MSQSTERLYEFGPFRVDPLKRLLLRDGQPVALTSKCFDTLLVLVEHRGQVLHKDELMERLWPDTAVEENNLTQQISALRRALGEVCALTMSDAATVRRLVAAGRLHAIEAPGGLPLVCLRSALAQPAR